MNKNIHALDLNIHLVPHDGHALFRWLVASFLIGKHIGLKTVEIFIRDARDILF
jgi:hypothetical protein